MPREGINTELFKIISSPPEWVRECGEDSSSPYFLTKHWNLIESFLNATTDSVRLVRASRASREILDEFDMGELEELRSTVQASELLRVIPYPRQTDHSAHTLYLYLLGIYLFFACQPLRVQIARFLKKKDKSAELVGQFLFQWVFVSLLHDIGYIFQGRSNYEIRAVDRMFRPPKVKSLIDEADEGLKQSVTNLITGMTIQPLESPQSPEDMLAVLRYIPWGSQANFANDIFESFSTYGPQDQQITASKLEDYAYQVASGGYDGFSEGTVDHAVASGLFLFRYSTFWFWLAKNNGFRGPFSVFRGNGYPDEDVVAACFAAAAHNLIGFHGEKYGPLEFEKNPILYLGVLCDELQKWDRFPAGERHLIDLNSFEEYCTDSERIHVSGQWDGDKVVFRFDEDELSKRVEKSLKRLESVNQFVTINPTSTEQVVEPISIS
jgi:hypothetical protein